jgi:predicted TPR repeat methyltransferase
MERTLAACGPGPFTAACELGAGVGGLTARLAPRCASLVAIDVAPTAVAEAARRLAPWPQAEARVGTVPGDLPDGRFDLIVASEVLYYLEPGALDATLAWLPGALVPGGRVVVVHWAGDAHDAPHTAAQVTAALRTVPELEPVLGEDGPTYRIDALERRA